MRVLVTGGSGVIGAGLVPELIRRGHTVRLLSRHADDDVKQFTGVEAFTADVADAPTLRGAAAGCAAVIHVAGIVSEKPPELTFERVNVMGTQNVVDEATRSSIRRFLYISSLGADRGSSGYHASKLAAEQIVARCGISWTVARPGAVYGPGDEVVSTIFKMVRALPAIPVIDHRNQSFQPIWYEDLAKALVSLLEDEGAG